MAKKNKIDEIAEGSGGAQNNVPKEDEALEEKDDEAKMDDGKFPTRVDLVVEIIEAVGICDSDAGSTLHLLSLEQVRRITELTGPLEHLVRAHGIQLRLIGELHHGRIERLTLPYFTDSSIAEIKEQVNQTWTEEFLDDGENDKEGGSAQLGEDGEVVELGPYAMKKAYIGEVSQNQWSLYWALI